MVAWFYATPAADHRNLLRGLVSVQLCGAAYQLYPYVDILEFQPFNQETAEDMEADITIRAYAKDGDAAKNAGVLLANYLTGDFPSGGPTRSVFVFAEMGTDWQDAGFRETKAILPAVLCGKGSQTVPNCGLL